MSIKYDNKTAKLIQTPTIRQNARGVEIGRIETITYNIEDILRKAPIENLHTHPGFLHLLYPLLFATYFPRNTKTAILLLFYATKL